MGRPRKTPIESYGLISVTKAGQISVPAQAQRSLGIAPESQVQAFGELATGRLIIAPAPPADVALAWVTEYGRSRRQRARGRRKV
jgi:bifunctional DNA-binding transcriptional regulator/antitoxin component of YhaV-PrlF toxin-antitoxin module